jgi:hypothetical protein
MVNQVGVVIGIQVMQTVQAARSTSIGDVAAYGEAYLVGGAMAAVGIFFAVFVHRSAPDDDDDLKVPPHASREAEPSEALATP